MLISKPSSIEGTFCTISIKKEGYIHLKVKDVLVTSDVLIKEQKMLKSFLADEKWPVLFDASDIQPIEKSIRELIDRIMDENFCALAFHSTTKVGFIVSKIFIELSNSALPKQIFDKKDKAKDWVLNLVPA